MYNTTISILRGRGATDEQLQEFNLFVCESGWEDWMNDYTEAEEDALVPEADLEKIENIQAENYSL